MNKNILLGVAIAGGAYLVYRYMMGPQSGAYSVSPYSNANMSTATQPAQQYPFQANQPPRVDNSNEPWYGKDRSGILGTSNPNDFLGSLAQDSGSIASIVDSAKSLWADLGVADWFQNDEPVQAMDTFQWDNWFSESSVLA